MTQSQTSTNLVTTAWLNDQLTNPHIKILDCSWHMPATKRSGAAEFVAAHIPGAQFFDIDANSDTANPLPHMLPADEKFASIASQLGIGSQDVIVCYDSLGLFSAARVWWMFKVFGHDAVAVLDGGLPKWVAEQRPVQSGPARSQPASQFTAHRHAGWVYGKQAMRGAEQIADARGPARFRGEEIEPRPGVRPGHIPGARNVYYASLLNPNGTLKSKPELAAMFKQAGLDVERPIVTSCGSGVTAAILSLALVEIGITEPLLYDGSWTEWGAATDTDIAMGP